jgi:hypothetical protein
MNLDIEMRGNAIVLKLPTRELDGQLDRLLTRGAGDILDVVPEPLWEPLYAGEALDIVLPLEGWRRALARLQRAHDFWRKPENRESFASRFPEEQRGSLDLGPLTFTLAGVVYDNPRDLPGPGGITVALGSFVLHTPTMLVTDPCYEKGTWCTGEFEARTGVWHARAMLRDDGHGGHRNAVLLVAHESLSLDGLVLAEMARSDIDAGVDSGQAGFFEKARYPDDKAQLESDDGTWYSAVCEITLDSARHGAGIAPRDCGAVSQTFWGDGGYPCFVTKDDAGLVIAAALVFDGSMSEDEEDDEDNRGDEV